MQRGIDDKKIEAAMRNKTHDDFITRWAEFVKNDKTRSWKKIHTEFINAQFKKSEEFYERLKKQPNGKKKIIEIFGIKNLKAYPSLQEKDKQQNIKKTLAKTKKIT
ncbi:hypothetical protein DRJ22_06040 [Candidatus Woesearchaeota archaeon]|nr:MAG: hypothetical protein B6U93_02465 [Candidatus Woesearchaeota archaeon ex4484_78]RLE44318.1 MAG: hypothetical protein DRJ22_06040 [Candidatus Woesearchaeota archaeon]